MWQYRRNVNIESDNIPPVRTNNQLNLFKDMSLRTIKFLTNPGDKLYSKCFVSIRLKNDEAFVADEIYNIELHHSDVSREEMGSARIVEKRHFKLRELNNFMSYLDMACSKEAGRKILTEKYKNPGEDSLFDFILFDKV